ncbi:hypothetical protein PMAYCL1PPCAC_27815, partial [Pristionchus mayeri]
AGGVGNYAHSIFLVHISEMIHSTPLLFYSFAFDRRGKHFPRSRRTNREEGNGILAEPSRLSNIRGVEVTSTKVLPFEHAQYFRETLTSFGGRTNGVHPSCAAIHFTIGKLAHLGHVSNSITDHAFGRSHLLTLGDVYLSRVLIRFLPIGDYNICLIEWTRSASGWTVHLIRQFTSMGDASMGECCPFDHRRKKISHGASSDFFRSLNSSRLRHDAVPSFVVRIVIFNC